MTRGVSPNRAPHPKEKTIPCENPLCNKIFCCRMHMRRHAGATHDGVQHETPTAQARKRDKRRDGDIGDALIRAFRRLLKESEQMYDLIRALQAQNEEFQTAFRDSSAEVRRLDVENANLRGRLLDARKARDVARKEIRVTPLADRLTPEELALLATFKEGRVRERA